MPTTIGVSLPLNAGTSATMTLELLDGGTPVNTDGDTLTETSNGYFEATVAETLTTGYEVRVKADGALIYKDWLAKGATRVGIGPAIGNVPTADDVVITSTGVKPSKTLLTGAANVLILGDSYSAVGTTFGQTHQAIIATGIAPFRGAMAVLSSTTRSGVITRVAPTTYSNTTAKDDLFQQTGIRNRLPFGIQGYYIPSDLGTNFNTVGRVRFGDSAKIVSVAAGDNMDPRPTTGRSAVYGFLQHESPDGIRDAGGGVTPWMAYIGDSTTYETDIDFSELVDSPDQVWLSYGGVGAAVNGTGITVGPQSGQFEDEENWVWHPVLGFWYDPNLVSGIMLADSIAAGGVSQKYFLSEKYDGGNDESLMTDTELMRLMEVYATAGFPINVILDMTGINVADDEGAQSNTDIGDYQANKQAMVNRWLNAARVFDADAGYLMCQPVPYGNGGEDKSPRTVLLGDANDKVASQYGNGVESLRVGDSFVDTYGDFDTWKATYLQGTAPNYLHFQQTQAAMEAWGSAIKSELERVSEIPSSVSVADLNKAEASIIAALDNGSSMVSGNGGNIWPLSGANNEPVITATLSGKSGLTFETVDIEYIREDDSEWQTLTPIDMAFGSYVSSGFVAQPETTDRYALGIPLSAIPEGKTVQIRIKPSNESDWIYGIVPVFEKMRGTNDAATNAQASSTNSALSQLFTIIPLNLQTQLTSILNNAIAVNTQTSASRIRLALGLNEANLDTQLNNIVTAFTNAFSNADIIAIRDAIILAIENDLDGTDMSTQAIATTVTDTLLNSILSGNYDAAGSVGETLQVLNNYNVNTNDIIALLNSIINTGGDGPWTSGEGGGTSGIDQTALDNLKNAILERGGIGPWTRSTGVSGGTSNLNLNINIPGSNIIAQGSNAPIYVKETNRVLRITANESLVGIPLELIFEGNDRIDIEIFNTVDDLDRFTITSDAVDFTIPDSYTDEPGTIIYGVRNANDQTFYGRGTLVVTYAPHKDSI